MLRQLFVGTVTHVTGLSIGKPFPDVQAFFRHHHEVKSDPLVVDGEATGYLSQIDSFTSLPLWTGHLVDICCGNGSLLKHLERLSSNLIKSYLGVDFAVAPRELAPSKQIVNADIKAFDFGAVAPITITAVNALCYVDELRGVPLLRKLARAVGHSLVVLEPYPGWFWDRSFSGLRPTYRSPEELCAQLVALGWRHESTSVAYWIKIGGKHLFPLSYSLAMRSTDEARGSR